MVELEDKKFYEDRNEESEPYLLGSDGDLVLIQDTVEDTVIYIPKDVFDKMIAYYQGVEA